MALASPCPGSNSVPSQYKSEDLQFGLVSSENTAVGICHADHMAPLYPQKLALTSPTSGGRSVGIVHLRTKATE
jgi:hypothetical protein